MTAVRVAELVGDLGAPLTSGEEEPERKTQEVEKLWVENKIIKLTK